MYLSTHLINIFALFMIFIYKLILNQIIEIFSIIYLIIVNLFNSIYWYFQYDFARVI